MERNKPALIIGIGGTGMKVLTRVKTELLADSTRGGIPNCIRLLAIDTVSGNIAGEHVSDDQNQISLDPIEFVFLGGDMLGLSSDMSHDKYPQIKSWFDANEIKNYLPTPSFNMILGAGQVRPFGRLAVFNDLLNHPERSRLFNSINNAIKDICSESNELSTLNVFVVASFAGGTGAGMFIDVSWLIRQIAEQDVDLDTNIKGLFVLPEAFGGIPGTSNDPMISNSVASIRELARLMRKADTGYLMYYQGAGSDPVLRERTDKRPFDSVFLFDGRRGMRSLGDNPLESGVVPAISDYISVMIDANTSREFGLINQGLSERGTEGYHATSYSALGTFSYVLPINQIVESLSCRLAMEALEGLLLPDEDGLQDQAVSLLSPDTLDYSEIKRSTPFLKEVFELAECQQLEAITAMAERNTQKWIDILILAENDQLSPINALQELTRKLQDEVEVSQRGEEPKYGIDRILAQVDGFKNEYLGPVDIRQGWRDGGSLKALLGEISRLHQEQFAQLLEKQCLKLLNAGNGPSEGWFGYIEYFLNGLENIFNRYLQVMDEVKGIIEGSYQQTQMASDMARRVLMDKPGGFGAKKRQQAYLQTEQKCVDWERSTQIFNTVISIIEVMRAQTQSVKKEAHEWLRVLGADHESIYGQLHQRRLQLLESLRVGSNIQVRKLIWDSKYEENLYQTHGGNTAENVIKNWIWHLSSVEGGKPRIRLQVGEEMFDINDKSMVQNAVLESARSIFSVVFEQETIMGRLMDEYKNPEDLAQETVEKVESLLQVRGDTVIPSMFLQVPPAETQTEKEYLKEFVAQLQKLRSGEGMKVEVNEADPFTVRSVSTLSSIALEQVVSHQESLRIYRSIIAEANRGKMYQLRRDALHVFPAELNAVRFESRLGLLNQPLRELSNEVVVQLEDIARFKQFVLCWAFGVIREVVDGENRKTVLSQLSDGEEDEIILTNPSSDQPSLLEALHRFNFKGRGVDDRPIDYEKVKMSLENARESNISCMANAVVIPESLEIGQEDQDSARQYIAEIDYLKIEAEKQRKLAEVRGEASVENDLATVFYMILVEKIETLQTNLDKLTGK